jgi:hypothetical protein
MSDFTIDQIQCHVCGTKYRKFSLGKKHVHATCESCQRRDEVGLAWG